jgi:hypothetical protein
METIFNYNPTPQELSDIRFDALSFCQKFGIDIPGELTRELYLELITQENAYYDLACLFEFRGDLETANKYWSKLPANLKYDGLGNDYALISTY